MQLNIGEKFLYANRKTKQPEECEVLDIEFCFPMRVIARNLKTNKVTTYYPSFGCFPLDKYDDALKDAQINEERIIY